MSGLDDHAAAAEPEEATTCSPIRVLPLDVALQVRPGETVLEAARRSTLRWPSICGGVANCTLCFVEVTEGAENAGPEGAGERERLEFAGKGDARFRLACQMRPSGPITVFKKNVKPIPPA